MDDHSTARRRIADCTAHLLGERQFYGYLLQQFDTRLESNMRAALRVSYSKEAGRIHLEFNPKHWIQPTQSPWIEGQTPTEPWTDANLVAALEHECLHVVLKHLVRHPKGNQRLWNIADDMVINQQLEGLPLGCVTLDYQGHSYPAGLHADGYYRLLMQHLPPCPIHGPQGSGGGPDKQEGAGKAPRPGSAQDPAGGRPGDGQGGGHGSGQGAQADPQGSGGHGQGEGPPCPYCSGQTLDDHGAFHGRGDAEAEEAMRTAVGVANQRYQEQKHRNDGQAGRGSLPSDVQRMIEAMLHRPINWRHRLHCIGGSAVRYGRRSTIRKPHRRYGTLFPGRKPARTGKVLVAVDTSGSVSDKLLGEFWCEVLAISRKVDVVVVECDAAVHDAWLLRRRGVPRLKGGGGSSFQGVFDLVQGVGSYPRKWRGLVTGASKMIFLTDGDIGVPTTNPTGLDVYWAVPSNCKAPTEAYGERIPMDVEQ